MRSRAWVVPVLVALMVVGCATAPPPPDPYRVPREEVRGKVKKVALVPVHFSRDVNDPDALKGRIEALVAAKLNRGGIDVIPSSVYEGLWRPMVVDMGGIFDRMTGKLDAAKAKIVREHTLRELRSRHGADGVLYLSVAEGSATIASGRATWDGVTEAYETHGFRGKIRALSLAVTLADTNGVTLYSRRGGLQTVERLDHWGRSGYLSKAVLLTDDNLLVQAVNISLGDLSGKEATGAR
jgi:hypothetical protein